MARRLVQRKFVAPSRVASEPRRVVESRACSLGIEAQASEPPQAAGEDTDRVRQRAHPDLTLHGAIALALDE